MKALSFEGSGAEYFKIWIVNVLLTVITLGLYYPWAKVRNNRYFYANSKLEDRNFEYHATGKQLFLGYLISMGILILYIVIQSISPTGSLFVLLALFLAFPWVIWQSLKFSMRMTSFSNVRFSFDGRLGQAYINYMLIPIGAFLAIYGLPVIAVWLGSSQQGGTPLWLSALFVILAIAFIPLIVYVFSLLKNRNTHYTLDGLRYGQGAFATTVKTGGFAKILLKTIGVGLLLLIVFWVVIAIAVVSTGVGNQQLSANMQDPAAVEAAFSGAVGWIVALLYIGFIVVSLILFSYLHSRQRKYIFENTQLDEKIAFVSTLKARPLAWVTVTNFLAVIFSLALALPWAKVRMCRLILENSRVDTDLGFDDYLTQKQDQQSSLGDQIGDAFDLDVGIGI